MSKLLFIALIMVSLCHSQKVKPIFDPSILKDPEPQWPTILNTLFDDSSLLDAFIQPDSVQVITDGFRVQVLATRFIDNADSLRVLLMNKYGLNVYVTFEAPNYKVRVGDFIDRAGADQLRKQLSANGYPSAWIIHTRIEPPGLGDIK